MLVDEQLREFCDRIIQFERRIDLAGQAFELLHEFATWARDEQLPVEVVTVNVFETRDPAADTPDARLDAVRAFWAKQGFTLPVAMDFTDQVAADYGVQGIPATFVIRSDGVVHARHEGAAPDYVELLKDEVRDALDELETPEAEGEPPDS